MIGKVIFETVSGLIVEKFHINLFKNGFNYTDRKMHPFQANNHRVRFINNYRFII